MNFITSRLKSLLNISASQFSYAGQNDDDDDNNEYHATNSNDDANVVRVDGARSENSYPWKTVGELVKDSRAIKTIHDSLSIDEYYEEFCIALGLKQPKIVALKKQDDRAYLALLEWTKAIRTLDEFVDVLVECDLEALAQKLNLGNQYQQRKTTVYQDSVDTAVVLVVGNEFGTSDCASTVENVLRCKWDPDFRISTMCSSGFADKHLFKNFPFLVARHTRCDNSQDDMRVCQTFILFNETMTSSFSKAGMELARKVYARFAGGVILSNVEATVVTEISVIRFKSVTSLQPVRIDCTEVLNETSLYEWKTGQYVDCDGWAKPSTSKQLTTNDTHNCDDWFQFLKFVKRYRFLIELSPHPHEGHKDIAWQSIVTSVTLSGAAINQHIGGDPATMAVVDVTFPRTGEFAVAGPLAKALKGSLEKKPGQNSTTFRFHHVPMGELRNIAVRQFTEQLFNNTASRVRIGDATIPMFELNCEEESDVEVRVEALSSVVNKQLELSKNSISNEKPSQLLFDNLFPLKIVSLDSNALCPDDWIDFARQFLASLCTFGESTPLTGSNFVRLMLYDSPGAYRDALRYSVPPGAMKPMTIDEILKKSNEPLFIFGDAGCGKSSILRNEMLRNDTVSLLVRADLLWQCRSKLRLFDSRSPAIVDAHRQTVALTQVTDQFCKEWIDDSHRTKELDSRLCKYIESGNCSLLIDALDEIPASERARADFVPWLEMLCKSWTNGTGDKNGLFRRVIISSCHGVLDNVPEHTQYSCIAPMEEREQQNYIQQLLDHLNCNDKFESVLKACESIGPVVSPLLLLMLCFTMKFVSSADVSKLNRFDIYDRFLDLLLIRSVQEKKIEFPSCLLENNRQLHDHNRKWIKDLFAFIGFCFHLLESLSDNKIVTKFDLALLLEITHANTPLRQPLNAPQNWPKNLFEAFNRIAKRKAVVDEEGVVMWILSLFDLNSFSASNLHSTLSDEVLFRHRSFQEFLAARALTLHPQREYLGVLLHFDWIEKVNNPCWSGVLAFVSALQGGKVTSVKKNLGVDMRDTDMKMDVVKCERINIEPTPEAKKSLYRRRSSFKPILDDWQQRAARSDLLPSLVAMFNWKDKFENDRWELPLLFLASNMDLKYFDDKLLIYAKFTHTTDTRKQQLLLHTRKVATLDNYAPSMFLSGSFLQTLYDKVGSAKGGWYIGQSKHSALEWKSDWLDIDRQQIRESGALRRNLLRFYEIAMLCDDNTRLLEHYVAVISVMLHLTYAAAHDEVGTAMRLISRLTNAIAPYDIADGDNVDNNFDTLDLKTSNRALLVAAQFLVKRLLLVSDFSATAEISKAYLSATLNGRWDVVKYSPQLDAKVFHNGEVDQYHEKALEIKKIFAGKHSAASTYRDLGVIASKQRKWNEGKNYLKKALVTFEKFTDRPSHANHHSNLGDVVRQQRIWIEAEHYYNMALGIFQTVDNESNDASTHHLLSALAGEQQQWQRAYMVFNAFQIYYRSHDVQNQEIAIRELVGYLSKSGDEEGIHRIVSHHRWSRYKWTGEEQRTVVGLAIFDVLGGRQSFDSRIRLSFDDSICSFSRTGKDFVEQFWYQCRTCSLVNDEGCCEICARICHADHEFVSKVPRFDAFFCDCGARGSIFCKALEQRTTSVTTSRSGTSVTTSRLSRDLLLLKPVRELKAMLDSRGIIHRGCSEKRHLVDLLMNKAGSKSIVSKQIWSFTRIDIEERQLIHATLSSMLGLVVNDLSTTARSNQGTREQWIDRFGELKLEDVGGDGDCQFRTLAALFYNDPEQYQWIRYQIAQYMRTHQDDFKESYWDSQSRKLDAQGNSISKFNSLEEYCDALEQNEWGTFHTLRAASLLYNCAIQVLSSSNGGCKFPLIGQVSQEHPVPLIIAHYSEFHFVLVRAK